MDDDHCVTVTHFINPHLFWFKKIEVPDEQLHVLSAVEQTLEKLYKNKPSSDNILRPQSGDKVAVNFIAWNKFIRAEILQKAEFQQEEYIVWALDYGFPLLTKKDYIRNLPGNLQVNISNIQIGGVVNLYPAEQEYDDMEGNLVMVKKDKWLQKTCNMLEKLLADANSISFVKHYENENSHVWGDLTITNHKGMQINARDYLLKTTNAVVEDDFSFKETCSKLKTTKIAPWLSNDRNTKMKLNNIKHNYIEHSKLVNATLIDENAKRKVEDWQERNERKKCEAVNDIIENSYEDNIDDVTFDDSVSVTQMNYIGKAGILTKIKQQKYSTAKDLPPLALPQSFEIDNIPSDKNWQTEPLSTPSVSTNGSSRIEKLAQMRIKQAKAAREEKYNLTSEKLNVCGMAPFIDLNSAESLPLALPQSFEIDNIPSDKNWQTEPLSTRSVSTNGSSRIEKLAQMRIKQAKAAREEKYNLTSEKLNVCGMVPFIDLNSAESSPLALRQSFEIDNIPSDKNWQTEPLSTRSVSTNGSSRIEKLAQMRIKQAKAAREEKYNLTSEKLNVCGMVPFIDLNSAESSSLSSVSSRIHKLTEMRKNVARAEKEEKIITLSREVKAMHNQKEITNSTISQPKTSDSISYQLLEQSTSLSTLNNTTTDNVQDNKSEISAKNIRIKQLIAMRKKFGSSNILSSNDNSQMSTHPESENCASSKQSKENEKDNNKIPLLSSLNFQLKQKMEEKIEPLNKIYSLPSPSKDTIKKNLKLSQSGYDSLTMVPAGYDITRLQTYKNEENHWHRKKSTRYDNVPHDPTSSADELLSNNTNDQSFSSSEFFQIKSLKSQNSNLSNGIISSTLKTRNNFNNVPDSQLQTCAQQQDLIKEMEDKNIGGNYLSSELSTSSNSTVQCQKLRKRRQLKSPTSQLSKIDKILQEHNIEKDFGNTNILDLKLLNTSSSSQKSLLSSTSKNIACNDRNLLPALQDESIKICSSQSSSSVDNIRNEKVYKEVFNYEALMNVKHTANLPLVEGERKLQTKFIDHLVLAHSSIQLTPIENISEAPFLPEIHEEMRQMRVNKVYRIQVYSWSHVLRNNSLFVVNPTRSGKTWSYLPPLCSLLCCRKDTFKPSYGPVAIILVASLKHVELINNYCRRLMSGLKGDAPTCITSYGMRNLIETKSNLLNGCGILVATPSNVLRLLQENENEPLFDAERLQHIVIDDMDIMMSRSRQDFENACRILFRMAKKSKFRKLIPQLIVTSRDWDGLMVKLIRKSNQPLLLIGDFLEAAVYGHATLSVKLKSSTKKNETILKFIKDISESAQGLDNRTLITCNNDEDVQGVTKFLNDCGYPCLGYYSRSTEIERVTIDEWKKKVSSQILVCTDTRFCELNIQNVNNLIHYSLPTSWTQFTTRFSALARTYNNYVSCFEQNNLSTTSATKKHCAHSIILLDENNNMQLPRLVDFMRKHNQKVQAEIQTVSKQVLIMREEQQIFNGSLLCPQLLEFGECDEARCDKRHELTRFDVISKSNGIPCSGEIRIHILKVFSPTYYAVRLLHHKPNNSKKWVETRRSSEALTFSLQLNMHYLNDNNLFLHWPPHINDICIYQYTGYFRRARILEAPIFQDKNTNVVQANLKVTLRLIDDGTVISSVKCNEIFVCDEKFKDFPPQAVDVRLINVVPYDNERTWDSKTTKQVQKWIIEDIKSNYVVQASIDFSLANTIWIKNMVVMEKLSGIDAYCQVVHLKKSLIENNFGILYKGDRKHVRDHAEEFGLLNSSGFDNDNDDSDLDYQSCKNESINLIKFSSSNDEVTNSSMESAETGLEPLKETEDKNIDFKYNKEKLKTVDIEIAAHEENWDNQLDSSDQLAEVYVPLKTKRFDTYSDENKSKSYQTNISIPSKKETWCRLTLNEKVKVEIGDEGENGNWENIFLQIIDINSMYLFEELRKLIAKHVDSIKSSKEKPKEIYDFEPLQNCIVKYNDLYLRAKVYGVFGENINQRLYRFLLCDYACFTNAKTEELYNDFLYETTEEIVTFTPYQAIHCTLAGIKLDRFTKRYQVTKDYLYACAVFENDETQKSTSNIQNLPINSYTILLYECEKEDDFNNALLFNKALVDNGITIHDNETKHFLEYDIKDYKQINDKVDGLVDATKSNDINKAYTFEQLINCIKSKDFDIDINDIVDDIKKPEMKTSGNKAIEIFKQNSYNTKADETADISEITNSGEKIVAIKGIEDISKVSTSDSENDEQGHCTTNSNSSVKSSSFLSSTDISNCSPQSSLPNPPLLKALYKRPLTTWYEDDYMIFLSINAPDINDYFLEVTSKTILFVAEIQSEKCVLILNLLGSIDPKCVSHEIKGLYVVIRLKKIVFQKWPRLLKDSTKYSWLKYNFNAFDSTVMEYIMPQQRLHAILDNEFNFESQQIDNYISDEDSERELYQTYNPIPDNDDCDPFSAL